MNSKKDKVLWRNKVVAKKAVTLSLVCLFTVSNTFMFSAQTLAELEKDIESLNAEIADNQETAASISEETANTKLELEEIQENIKSLQVDIADNQAEITSLESEIAAQEQVIKDIQAKIPEAKEEAGEVLAMYQKLNNGNVMLQLVTNTPTNEEDEGAANILRRIESVNKLSEYASEGVINLIELERELQYEKTVLDKKLAQLESKKTALDVKEEELSKQKESYQAQILEQTEQLGQLDSATAQNEEDLRMMEDSLAYYESYGCTSEDEVGSNCGGLGDDDGDGVINADDSCPNEYGDQADGCIGDDDGDGLDNFKDSCPATYALTSNGCPVEKEPEQDVDEVESNNNTNASNNGGGSTSSSSSATFSNPLSTGVITCDYGCYSGHVGIDFDNADYDPILSTGDGVVLTARSGCEAFGGYLGNSCNGGYGNYVLIAHYTNEGTFFSLYAHMSSLSVSQGQTVSRGQQIGKLGHSGNSSGSHLHFELYKDANGNGVPDDYKTNPRLYLDLPAPWSWW